MQNLKTGVLAVLLVLSVAGVAAIADDGERSEPIKRYFAAAEKAQAAEISRIEGEIKELESQRRSSKTKAAVKKTLPNQIKSLRIELEAAKSKLPIPAFKIVDMKNGDIGQPMFKGAKHLQILARNSPTDVEVVTVIQSFTLVPNGAKLDQTFFDKAGRRFAIHGAEMKKITSDTIKALNGIYEVKSVSGDPEDESSLILVEVDAAVLKNAVEQKKKGESPPNE